MVVGVDASAPLITAASAVGFLLKAGELAPELCMIEFKLAELPSLARSEELKLAFNGLGSG